MLTIAKKRRCINSGARVMLSCGEAIDRRVRCSWCSRVLKIRVPEGVNEATLPVHVENLLSQPTTKRGP